jgi:hypothetical protein
MILGPDLQGEADGDRAVVGDRAAAQSDHLSGARDLHQDVPTAPDLAEADLIACEQQGGRTATDGGGAIEQWRVDSDLAGVPG